MQHELIDVLIVEDENELAQLHAELIGKHPRLRLVGIAASLADAQVQLESKQPKLMLLDNYLPDGKGITLISNPMLTRANCSVIFITAASDMDTCSRAIRNGAFDYILKPVSSEAAQPVAGAFCAVCRTAARLEDCRPAERGFTLSVTGEKLSSGQRQQRDRGEHAGAGANAV